MGTQKGTVFRELPIWLLGYSASQRRPDGLSHGLRRAAPHGSGGLQLLAAGGGVCGLGFRGLGFRV